MKRIPIEQRKVSITIALAPDVLSRLDRLASVRKRSRSSIIAEAIFSYMCTWAISDSPDEDAQDIPDDVSEIGYNPFTGSYEEDL